MQNNNRTGSQICRGDYEIENFFRGGGEKIKKVAIGVTFFPRAF